MADSDLDLARAGGRFNIDGNALLTATDIDRIGSMSEQSLITVLSLLFFDAQRGEPLTGFPRDTNTRNHCTINQTGDLTFTIRTGWGMLYGAGGGTDEFGPNSYLPIVVDAEINDTLDAHDGSNPRIDIVCLKPEYIEDQPATRNVKNPTTGVITSTSINQRRRYGADHVIVAGTPAAEPGAPATSAGYVEIARARVPAGSGAAVWSDSRPVLQFGGFFVRAPGTFVENHVPLGDSGELLVTADSPASMYVEVAAGRADVEGMRRGYPAQRVQIPAAEASDDRIDVVYVSNTTNVVQVVSGTPSSGTPVAPALPSPAIQVALAEIFVEGGSSTVTSGDITDVRVRQPFTDDQIQPASVNHDRLSVRTAVAKIVSTGSTSGNTRTFTIGVVGPDGEELTVDDSNVEVEVRIEASATGTVAGAGYDLTDADWTVWSDPAVITNPTVVISDEGGGTAGTVADVHSPRLRVLVTPGTPRSIAVRRISNAISPTVRVTVRVPGIEEEECPGGEDQFSFTFP